MSENLFHDKDAVFWVAAPCILVNVYQRLGGAGCFHAYRPDHSHLNTCRHQNLKSHVFFGDLENILMEEDMSCVTEISLNFSG